MTLGKCLFQGGVCPALLLHLESKLAKIIKIYQKSRYPLKKHAAFFCEPKEKP